MSKDTGGPAFPIKDASTSDALGMTLRDYFAAKAMQAFVGDYALMTRAAEKKGVETSVFVTSAAYEMADTMLAMREVK